MDPQIPPGPEYYAARRTLWLRPKPGMAERDPLLANTTGGGSRERLEEMLNQPMDNEKVKQRYEKVWKGFSNGARLKQRLPMKLVIKIIYAAWVRDSTYVLEGGET